MISSLSSVPPLQCPINCAIEDKCIPLDYLCDGLLDCVDGSDETMNIDETPCSGSENHLIGCPAVLNCGWPCDPRDVGLICQGHDCLDFSHTLSLSLSLIHFKHLHWDTYMNALYNEGMAYSNIKVA